MVTQKRKLRSGNSVWMARRVPHIRSDTDVAQAGWDAIVVGAGLTAALVGHALARRGKRVLFVDRREPLQGSTLATTALVQWELDTLLNDLAQKIGAKNAARAYRRSFEAVASLRKLIHRHSISCEWHDRSSLYLAGAAHGFRALKTESRLRLAMGLPSAYVGRATVRARYGFRRTGALVSQGAGEVNPVLLAAELLGGARGLGARIVTPFEVAAIDVTKTGVMLSDPDGRSYEGSRAIFCTGYEVLKQLPKERYRILSTYAIATEPVEGAEPWAERSLIWEAAKPYLYLRTTRDNRILAGGEDVHFEEAHLRDRLMAEKSRTLLRKVRELFARPKLRLAYAWAGNFAESPTGLPFIGEPGGLKRCLAVLGSGGNGITFGMVAAQIAEQWLEGEKDEDMELFDGSLG
jgi:glycine/D-amino acid oxidase-like deaminating enzyme